MSTLQRKLLHLSKGLGSSFSKKKILYPNGQSAERPWMNFKYSFSSNLLSTILKALSIGGLETSFGELFILFLMVCTWGRMSVLRVKEADLEVL